MIDYRAGDWGFHVSLGWRGSLAPRALAVAIPNAVLTLIVALLLQHYGPEGYGDEVAEEEKDDTTFNAAQAVITAFSVVMLFILYNRSRTSYSRWWEGGTLLQKTRGEWFNAYSSIMAFTSTKPELEQEVTEYSHLVARLFSLLMCCGLQQVSPQRDRPFQIIELSGVEQTSMDFLNSSPDKVEVILQWIQRSMVLQAHNGVLPVPPPILSRAFQEISRGIVNVQNARKIADFPYPFPLAQVSMILQLVHWVMTPLAASLAFPMPWAVLLAFVSIFTLWCIHFNALDLEFPFGARVNDLPMDEFQEEWNKSLITFLNPCSQRPPLFKFSSERSSKLEVVMSDASEQYTPSPFLPKFDKGTAVIRIEPHPEPAIPELPLDPNEAAAMDAVKYGAAINGEAGIPVPRNTNASKPRPRRQSLPGLPMGAEASAASETSESRPLDVRSVVSAPVGLRAGHEGLERHDGLDRHDGSEISGSAEDGARAEPGFSLRHDGLDRHDGSEISGSADDGARAGPGTVASVSEPAEASSSLRQPQTRWSTPVPPDQRPLGLSADDGAVASVLQPVVPSSSLSQRQPGRSTPPVPPASVENPPGSLRGNSGLGDDGEVASVSQPVGASSSLSQRQPRRSRPPVPPASVPSPSDSPPAAMVGATADDVSIDFAGIETQ